MAEQPKLQIEFKGGPLDGTFEMYPWQVKPTITVDGAPEGHYKLYARRGAQPPPPDEGEARVLMLGRDELEARYRYFWIPKPL